MARKRQRFEEVSGLWHGRREVARDHRVGETGALMAAVAERLVGRLSAAAKRDHGAPAQAEAGAGWVEDFEVALDADGAVGIDGDFGGCHQERVAGNRGKSKTKPILWWEAV